MFGLLELHGPFTVNYVNQMSSTENDRNVTAEMNPYAWSKKSNMIYIDNPVGAGKISDINSSRIHKKIKVNKIIIRMG